MMSKKERDGQAIAVSRCCWENFQPLYRHALAMDAFLRELDAMLARGETATAVQTRVRAVLQEIER